MAKRTKIGACHVCMEEKKLTYEHVPPKRAYNNLPGVAHTLSTALSRTTNVPLGSVVRYHGGMGCRTLCRECNEFTAYHYGAAFAEWVRQALTYADKYERVDGRDNYMDLPFFIEPLAVLKQIATMVLAVAETNPIDALYPLRRFVLMPFEHLTANDVAFRVYLNPKRSNWTQPQTRMNGTAVIMDTKTGTSTMAIADIAFPPLGYWVAWTDQRKRHLLEYEKLADVTHFGRYRYGRREHVWVRMPVRLPVGPIMFHEQYQK